MLQTKLSQKTIGYYFSLSILMVIVCLLSYFFLLTLQDFINFIVTDITQNIFLGIGALVVIYFFIAFYNRFFENLKKITEFVFPLLLILSFYLVEPIKKSFNISPGWFLIPIIIIWAFLYTFYLYKTNNSLGYSGVLFVLALLLFILFGFWIIKDLVVNEESGLGLYFNDCYKGSNGNFNRFEDASLVCKGAREDKPEIFVGSIVKCYTEQLNLENIIGYYVLTFNNDSSKIFPLNSSSFVFIAPEKLSRFEISLFGKVPNENRITCVSSGAFITFPSYNDLKNQKLTLAIYITGFIAFILVYAPTIFEKWEELIKKLFFER